jgi:hypothetical protein
MTEVVMAFQPGPPPPGAGNPFDWGREEYVRSRLHEAFELEFLPGESPQIAPSAEAIWELYVTSGGPVKTLADTLPSDRYEALGKRSYRSWTPTAIAAASGSLESIC